MESLLSRRSLTHVLRAFIALGALLAIGVAGYRWIENLSWIDALYMAVITLSTVGFGEVHTFSPAGRLFAISLIIGGGGVAAYSLMVAAEYFLSGEWQTYWAQRRQKRMLTQLRDHVIVCGFGRVGRFVAQELRAEGVAFVIIDQDQERLAIAQRYNYLALPGNAANEHLLHEAGIARARALVAAVNSDAENVYITLTARGLRPDLLIVARANYEESESKLVRAGANRTLLPYRLSGRRMVTMIVRPEVADFLDEVAHASDMEFVLEQISIAPHSPLVGKTIHQAHHLLQLDLAFLACKYPGGAINTRPSPETILLANTQIITLGTREQLKTLMKMAEGQP